MNSQAHRPPRTPARGPGRAHGGAGAAQPPLCGSKTKPRAPSRGLAAVGPAVPSSISQGRLGGRGLKVVPTERKHVSVCTAGSSNEKKQRGRGEETGEGQELLSEGRPATGTLCRQPAAPWAAPVQHRAAPGGANGPCGVLHAAGRGAHAAAPCPSQPCSQREARRSSQTLRRVPPRSHAGKAWSHACLQVRVPEGWLVLPQGEAEG